MPGVAFDHFQSPSGGDVVQLSHPHNPDPPQHRSQRRAHLVRQDREELVLGHRRRLRRHTRGLFALEVLRPGDVFDGQKDQGGLASRQEHTASVEEHRPPPDRRELVLDLELFDDAVSRQDLLQQRA